jgi:uroporphyrinogen decarboxylase
VPKVIQLFDSWAGVLPPDERERWVTAPLRRIVQALRESCPGVPVIIFPRGVGPALVEVVASCQAGRGRHRHDHRHRLGGRSTAGRGLSSGQSRSLALISGGEGMCRAADRILDAWTGRPFIFNLGHGVVPETPPEHVAALLHHLKSREK